jgi:FKBP-type peptidyl-prolyl cis-trans isomerase FkpA
MRRHTLLALLLAAAAGAGACQKASTPPAAMTEEQKTLYALGAMVGQRFVLPMRCSEQELEQFIRGVRATARGGQPEFAVADYGPRFDALAKSRAAAGAADAKAKAAETRSQAASFRDAAAAEAGAVQLPSGLVYRTLQPGSGRSPQPTDVVRVHYHGTLPDGKVFDSSVARGQPAEFPLNQVIPCWTEGVQRMKLGEKAKLVCPSEIAYGDGGTPDGTIPPGATLVFEVELLEIKAR